MKSIIREILIIILLCVAIGLVLCIVFYNYIPSNITVPSQVEAYTTPNSIKNEINEEVAEYPKQNIVFEITDSDLTLYKQSQSYDPGKSNPFAEESTTTSNESNTGTSALTNQTIPSNSNNTKTNTSIGNTSSGTFFEDTKLK